MPINLELIENGYIVWFRVEGSWNDNDIFTAKKEAHRVFSQAEHIVHALVDLRRASVNMALIRATQQIIGGEPLPNSGQIAVVGVARLMRMLVEPILRVISTDPITFFDTIEDAKKYLRKHIPQDKQPQ
jgi:hypothetical protein